jgi:hypothetical protein
MQLPSREDPGFFVIYLFWVCSCWVEMWLGVKFGPWSRPGFNSGGTPIGIGNRSSPTCTLSDHVTMWFAVVLDGTNLRRWITTLVPCSSALREDPDSQPALREELRLSSLSSCTLLSPSHPMWMCVVLDRTNKGSIVTLPSASKHQLYADPPSRHGLPKRYLNLQSKTSVVFSRSYLGPCSQEEVSSIYSI